MRIVNATETSVPIGRFTGMDLQEFAQEHTWAAEQLLADSTFKLEYTEQYFDLDYYLRGVRRAKRFMRRH